MSLRVLKRYYLRGKESKQLLSMLSKLSLKLPNLGTKPKIEIISTNKGEIIVINMSTVFIKCNGEIIPSLVSSYLFDYIPSIVIDMNAVPHICNGADVMIPGITSIKGNFLEKDIVAVRDERHFKVLAVGKALLSSERIKSEKRGKAIKNLHYIGDRFWNLLKELGFTR